MRTPILPLATALAAIALICLHTVAVAAEHPFEKDIKAFEAADRKNSPPKGAILFVGDSTFTKWTGLQKDFPEFTVINRGFGGSTMTDLRYYVDRVIIPYQPRLIVIQEGGNDIHSGHTPEQLRADTKGVIEKIRAALPETPIVLDGTTPSPSRWSEAETRKKANAMLQAFAATQKKVTYVNLFDAFLGADGTPRAELYAGDKLHPSQAGFDLRVQILRPLLGPPDRSPPVK